MIGKQYRLEHQANFFFKMTGDPLFQEQKLKLFVVNDKF